VGRAHLGDTGAVLYLNPDVELDGASVGRLLAALREDGVGAAVPRMPGAHGEFFPSLRREPTLRRALGDALFGERFASRPGTWSEIVLDRDRYARGGDVDWATGAAIMVRRDVDAAVGPWDERFFLYSEETDLCARIRAAGHRVRYVPDAVARHEGGASGASPALEALMAVNRVRYYEKYHGPLAALAFRGLVTLHETLRLARGPGHRAALRAVVDRRAWERLPRATRAGDPAVVR
jgi:GT2 family glycosyltransferase